MTTTTNFQIVSGTSVPSNYFWDMGRPLETAVTETIADTFTDYISGFAPAVKVVFQSDVQGTIEPGVSASYIWNFGDYYNANNNEAVFECRDSLVEHTYILPGKYNVSLTNTQSKLAIPPATGNERCNGKYDIGWYWANTECERSRVGTATTWDETMCFPPATAINIRPKWWDDEGSCFQKYCKYWNWQNLAIIGKNPVFWFQTRPLFRFFKRWGFEANDAVCEDELKTILEVTEQTALKTAIVEVIEIKPTAVIYNISSPLTGVSPFAFTLSPKFCKTGSFPIDRIEWNAGDGSSIKTITRYSEPNSEYFIYNNTYFDDPQDPRNYDFIYTINRNRDMYPVFYPSLTCYSACTNSSDSCSIVIGPIELEPQSFDVEILKTKNTIEGEYYGVEINNNITLLTTLTSNKIAVTPTQPSTPIKQITKTKKLVYFGNTGEGFPPNYTPDCNYIPSEYDYIYFEIEESQDSTPDILAILLEQDLLLYK